MRKAMIMMGMRFFMMLALALVASACSGLRTSDTLRPVSEPPHVKSFVKNGTSTAMYKWPVLKPIVVVLNTNADVMTHVAHTVLPQIRARTELDFRAVRQTSGQISHVPFIFITDQLRLPDFYPVEPATGSASGAGGTAGAPVYNCLYQVKTQDASWVEGVELYVKPELAPQTAQQCIETLLFGFFDTIERSGRSGAIPMLNPRGG